MKAPSSRQLTVSAALALCTCFVPVVAHSADDDAAKLDTMVVTAAGFGQQIEDAPASISVVTRKQLEEKSYNDVTDALQDMPGVVVTGGGSQKDISIRGMSSKYTLILVDGKRQGSRETRPNSDGPGIEQEWLPPLAAIDHIEVVRGPMSSLYGSDAMGGVINIITRKVSDHWYGTLGAQTTIQERSKSGNGQRANAYVSGPLVKGLMGLQVYGVSGYRHEDKFVNGFNSQRENEGNVKLSITPNASNDITLEYGRSIVHRDSHVGKTIATEGCRGDCENSLTTYFQDTYAADHTVRWGNVAQTDSYIQTLKTDNPSRQMNYRETTSETKTSFFLGSHILTVGGQYIDQRLKDDGNLEGSDLNTLKRWNYSLFMEDEWAMTDSFSLTGGARFNKDKNYGSHWSPRLYGVWHLTDDLTMKGGVSTGYRTPDLRAAVADWGQITGGGGVPAVIIGNPDLKPEKSVTEELGLVWDATKDLQLGATVYNTDFKDKITEVRTCTDPDGNATCEYNGEYYKFVSNRINVDKARMRGVELTADWNINQDWNVVANYTYTDTEQRTGEFSGQPLNEMPKHMVNTTFNWNTTDRLKTWTRFNWRGKESSYLSRTSMSQGTSSYLLVDLGGVYQATKQLKLTAGVYNVLDKRIDYGDFNKVLDGRRYGLGMSFDF